MAIPNNTKSQPEVNVLVRPAKPQDVSQIVSLGAKFHAESPFSGFTDFSAGDFEQTALALIEGRMPGCLFVASRFGEIVGIAGSIRFPLFFNLSVTAEQEVFLWADPANRNGIGMRLLDALESAAVSSGASVFLTGALAGLRDEAVGRAYRRRGYRAAENTYIKDFAS
jgi:hypothetical protein